MDKNYEDLKVAVETIVKSEEISKREAILKENTARTELYIDKQCGRISYLLRDEKRKISFISIDMNGTILYKIPVNVPNLWNRLDKEGVKSLEQLLPKYFNCEVTKEFQSSMNILDKLSISLESANDLS